MNDNIDAAFFRDIGRLIEEGQIINKQVISLVELQVDEIISNCDTDGKRIEVLLDILLDCAGMDNDALILFKRLCRYYYRLNPSTTSEYVYTYRDLYDGCADDLGDDDDTQ